MEILKRLLLTGVCVAAIAVVSQGCSDTDRATLYQCMTLHLDDLPSILDTLGIQTDGTGLQGLPDFSTFDVTQLQQDISTGITLDTLEAYIDALCSYLAGYGDVEVCTSGRVSGDCSEDSMFKALDDGYQVLQQEYPAYCTPVCVAVPQCVVTINATLMEEVVPVILKMFQGQPYDQDKLKQDCETFTDNMLCVLPGLSACPGFNQIYIEYLAPYMTQLEYVCEFKLSDLEAEVAARTTTPTTLRPTTTTLRSTTTTLRPTTPSQQTKTTPSQKTTTTTAGTDADNTDTDNDTPKDTDADTTTIRNNTEDDNNSSSDEDETSTGASVNTSPATSNKPGSSGKVTSEATTILPTLSTITLVIMIYSLLYC